MVCRFAAVVALVVLGCGSPNKSGTKPQGSAVVTGKLALDVTPADAEVEVDGAPRGKASDLKALELVPGPHQIVIKKPGFEIWRGEVAIETTETIQVRLVPKK